MTTPFSADTKPLLALAALLPELEAAERPFGTCVFPESGGLPFWEWSPIVIRVHDVAYAEGWVRDLDWPPWAHSDTGRRLMNEPEAIRSATSDELAWILTVSIRADRFCEGALVCQFENGVIPAVLRRAQVLAEMMQN